MIFRQLFDQDTWTYTYLVGDPATRKAALIDPVLEKVERDLQLIRELGLELTHVLETHVHADHVTAAGQLRKLAGATVYAHRNGADCVDVHVGDGDEIKVGELVFRVLETPGHTDDSLSFHINDRVFTGDALLIRGTGRTDFQNGDSAELYRSLTEVLFALPDDTLVFPGHDYRGHQLSSIGEEKEFNPRVAGKTKAEFIQILAELNLPRPRFIDVAVPANRSCGEVAVVPHG